MATKDALIAEEGNNVGGGGDTAVYDKNAEVVNFELEPTSIGLTKEQLEKYRDDPFWKPVRAILFAFFWATWVFMFGAAIAIVLLSPKCAEKQKPSWWQTKVSYQILTGTFRDSDGDGVGDFAGITEKIDFLRKIGVTTIYPTPVLQVSKDEFFNPYDVVDHMSVEPRFGTEEEFKQLIETVHNRDMYLVMDLPVSTISSAHKWFAEEKNPDMFVTARPTDAGFNSTKFFPFHGSNTLKYLGYPGSENPVLNWKNEKVKQSIHEAIKKFLLLGVDGFHIDHVSQLSVDSDGKSNHDEAIQTLKEITTSIRDFIAKHNDLSDKKIVLYSSLQDIEELHSVARETGLLHYVIDNSFASLTEASCVKEHSSVAKCVSNALDVADKRHEADDYSPYWQFSNADEARLASRFDSDTANLLTFLQLTLPGAMSVYYGQELGLKNGEIKTLQDQQRGIMQWTPKGNDHHGFTNEGDSSDLFFAETKNSETDNFETQFALETSPLKVYRKLAKLRQRDEALIVGDTVRHELFKDVIVFSRFVRADNSTAQGNAYVVALNFGTVKSDIELSSPIYMKLIPANKNIHNVEVFVTTTNMTQYEPRQKLDLATETLVLPPKQAIIFKL